MFKIHVGEAGQDGGLEASSDHMNEKTQGSKGETIFWRENEKKSIGIMKDGQESWKHRETKRWQRKEGNSLQLQTWLLR